MPPLHALSSARAQTESNVPNTVTCHRPNLFRRRAVGRSATSAVVRRSRQQGELRRRRQPPCMNIVSKPSLRSCRGACCRGWERLLGVQNARRGKAAPVRFWLLIRFLTHLELVTAESALKSYLFFLSVIAKKGTELFSSQAGIILFSFLYYNLDPKSSLGVLKDVGMPREVSNLRQEGKRSSAGSGEKGPSNPVPCFPHIGLSATSGSSQREKGLVAITTFCFKDTWTAFVVWLPVHPVWRVPFATFHYLWFFYWIVWCQLQTWPSHCSVLLTNILSSCVAMQLKLERCRMTSIFLFFNSVDPGN